MFVRKGRSNFLSKKNVFTENINIIVRFARNLKYYGHLSGANPKSGDKDNRRPPPIPRVIIVCGDLILSHEFANRTF